MFYCCKKRRGKEKRRDNTVLKKSGKTKTSELLLVFLFDKYLTNTTLFTLNLEFIDFQV